MRLANRIQQLAFREASRALPLALSLCIATQPALAAGVQGSWTPQSFAPALGGQAGAQQQAAGTNSLAANLGKAAAVLSMAAGGLYMAKGATQLKCCSSNSCTGSGTGSEKKKDELEKDAKKKASTISSYNCPVRAPASAPFLLFNLFQPPQADAALGPCLDALIALTTGGLMLLQGIMAMQAANQADQMANNSLGNAGNMGSYPGAIAATSPTPDGKNNGPGGPGNSKLGEGGGSVNPIKLDPALLRTGKANDIMNQFESKFGIPRDQFANKVLGGEDPRQVLGSAPMNALSSDDMNKATRDAKAMSAADQAAALAKTPIGDAQRELASKLDGADKYAVSGSGGAVGSAFKGAKKAAEADLSDAVTGTSTDSNLSLSPDVQAALAAKELDDRKNGITDLTIFEVVHSKYREKCKSIFGFDPDNLPKGVTK